MARILVTRRLPGDALARLRLAHDVDLHEDADGGPPPYAELAARASQAEGLLCLLTDRIDAPLLDGAPDLKVVSNMAVGVDNIDLHACAARGIPVGNTPGVLTEATADLAMALMLAAARRLPEGIAAVRDGTWGPWDPSWLLGLELSGATLGIVGRGRIGDAVARRAEAFGMEVLHASRTSGHPLAHVLEQADIVSVHCPLTPDTRGLIGAAAFERMKPTAILVNTARGPIVDQAALAAALHSGEIGAAALDVTDPEPLPPGDPLLGAPNLIVIPHLGSATQATRAKMASLAVDNVMAGVAGEPLPHPVAPPGA